MKRHLLIFFPLIWLLGCSTAETVQAQQEPVHQSAIEAEEYLVPPDHIKDEILAPRHENVNLTNLDPSGRYFLNEVSSGLTQLEDLAREHVNLGGLQLDPNAERQRYMSQSTTIGLQLIDSRDGSVTELNTPEDARITGATWSPDGNRLAYFAHYQDESHVYSHDLENNEADRLTDQPALPTAQTGLEWSGDSRHVYAVVRPENRMEKPQKSDVPTEPKVRVNSPDRNFLRTYQSLLENPYERELVKYFTTGQLTRIDADTGDREMIGEPDLISNLDVAPSGEHMRVTTYETPFPYIVPVFRSGNTETIWNLEGEQQAVLHERVPREGIPDSTTTEDFGRSEIAWRPDGNGLSFVREPGEEEEDDDDIEENGNQDENDENENEEGYEIVQWLPPFDDDSQEVIYTSDSQIDELSYSEDAETLFITQSHGNTERLFAVFTDDPDTSYTIYEYDTDDFYADPGNLMEHPSEAGPSAVRIYDGHVYLRGTEYDEDPMEQAPQPFVDRVEIETGETERIFESSSEMYEQVITGLDDQLDDLILRRQSPDVLPDSWLYNRADDDYTQLTDNTDYSPEISGAQRERFEIERADGLTFWGEIILPPDYDGDEELPALIWHYPREFESPEDVDDSYRTYNKNTFPNVFTRSPEIFVKHGYAVVRPDFPIVATEGTANDNFVLDVVNNFTAIIDEVDRMGYIDRDRLAAGGHSYGAFGTANAMNHTSFFRAGIAGNGNYNRTLTPLGFQREQRDLWRARERYFTMSPMLYAERMNGALLMYHGDEDQNVGTWPTNSERLIHALNGLGKDAAMYMYPNEGHGPSAEQTLLDLWTRWAAWLDYYVKHKGELDDEEGIEVEAQAE